MIIANFKSNVINFDRWVDDFVNSCPSVEFFVGIAPPSIYIYEYSNVIRHMSNQDESIMMPVELQLELKTLIIRQDQEQAQYLLKCLKS